jgi:hypothetical protein
MYQDILISMGVSALLMVVAERKERSKWASALAKVFWAISNASQKDPDLEKAIEAKRPKP